MGKFADLTGRRFGRLVVIQRLSNDKSSRARWLCQCDCGGSSKPATHSLKSGNTQSCGCFKQGNAARRAKHSFRFHGLSRTVEGRALAAAIQRCKPDHEAHSDYYDRGIAVCLQWQQPRYGVEDFVAHIGPRPSSDHSLDRINNAEGYEPDNVRWATAQEQTANRRKNQSLSKFSDKELLAEISRRGLNA